MRKKLFTSNGFIQIPMAIVLFGIVVLSSYATIKTPQIIQEREFKKISQDTSIPAGGASSEEILVGFKPSVSNAQRDLSHQRNKSNLKRRIKQINTDSVRVSTGATIQETIEYYQSLPEVEYAEPNFLVAALFVPNDTLYSKQWNLQKILSEDSYNYSQGGFGPIAIIDTGVDAHHPDLAGLVIEGYNTIANSNNTVDDNGHGTHVAGIASAQTNNSNGIASISYQSTILPIKVLNAYGVGTYDDVAEGIVYATDKYSRIINMSLGGSSDSQTLKRAINYALNRGSIIVASAGNNGSGVAVYPAIYSGVLAVSASDKNDNLASFSSYGNNIFVASPGVSVISSMPGGKYAEASGTSTSAPHLSGLIALALSKNPNLTNSQIIEYIKNNAEKVGSYTYDENGWNPYFGYGRISSGKTLKSIAESELEGDIEISPTETIPPLDVTSTSRVPTQTNAPEEHSFSFSFQGSVESVDLEQSVIKAKVDGGTPNIMSLLSGNLVTVYIDSSTRIKHQNNLLALVEVVKESKINVKGNMIQNRLVALEVLVQFIPPVIPNPTMRPVETLPDQNQNPAQQVVPQEFEQKPQIPMREIELGKDQLPEQAQGRGQVRGTKIYQSIWQQIKLKLASLF